MLLFSIWKFGYIYRELLRLGWFFVKILKGIMDMLIDVGILILDQKILWVEDFRFYRMEKLN